MRVEIIFNGENVDPSFLTTDLGVTPDHIIEKRDDAHSRAQWKFGFDADDDDCESGGYQTVHNFLSTRPQVFEKLRQLGYDGYFQVHHFVDAIDDFVNESPFFNKDFVTMLAASGLGLNVWFRKELKNPGNAVSENNIITD